MSGTLCPVCGQEMSRVELPGVETPTIFDLVLVCPCGKSRTFTEWVAYRPLHTRLEDPNAEQD